MPTIHSRSKSFLGYYPEKISEFFDVFTSVNSIPKKKLFKDYVCSFIRSRSIFEPVKDALAVLKLIIGVFK